MLRLPTPPASPSLLVLLLFLSACSLPAMQPGKPLESWQMNGKVAVRAGEESGTASLLWKQLDSRRYSAQLSGPMGQGTMRLYQDLDGVRLEQPGEEVIEAPDMDALFAAYELLPLPMDHLSYWLRGREHPGSAATANKDADGRLESLQQAGWTIDYLSYGKDRSLPKKIRMANDEVKATVIVRLWKTLP